MRSGAPGSGLESRSVILKASSSRATIADRPADSGQAGPIRTRRLGARNRVILISRLLVPAQHDPFQSNSLIPHEVSRRSRVATHKSFEISILPFRSTSVYINSAIVHTVDLTPLKRPALARAAATSDRKSVV